MTAIPPGTRLRIEARPGHEAIGVLQAVDQTQLTLQRKPPAARDEIRRVELLGARRTSRLATLGFLVGAVSGGALGYATAQANKGPWAMRMGLGWGAIGAAIGAIEGLQSRERLLIYRKPSR